MQTKLESLLESIANTIIGILIAFVSQMFLFQLTGIHASVQQSALVTVGMALISFIRSYLLRRIFNRRNYVRSNATS